MDAVRRAPLDNWFPFGPAVALMKASPVQNVTVRREIFAVTYAIYRKRQASAASLEPMIEEFWRELPRDQVLELIPIILKEAIRGDIYFIKRPMHAYEGLKPKLLPILRELDSAKAEQWERDEKQTFEEIRIAGPSWAEIAEIRRQQESMDVTPAQSPAPYKKPSGSPKPRAVAGCLENEPWCQQNRVEHALESIEEHLKRNEMGLAKAGINRGYWIARSQWKLDTDPLDPNQVSKAHWPSTVNWEVFSVMPSRIFPEYVLRRVKEIPDSEIRLLTWAMLARM